MTIYGNNSIRTFGKLSYGDASGTLSAAAIYEFPPTYTLSFNSKPVYSDNGVSVKYNLNELTVTWTLPYEYITGRLNPASDPFGSPSPQSIDTAVQQIRSILMQPRKELICTYQGLGPASNNSTYGMVINASNDLNFGPKPLDFKWRNLAAQQAVEMVWVVSFHTNNQIVFDASNNVTKIPSIFTELSWSRSFDIDELGSVTITTTGKYSIASYVNQHSDSYRVVAGFPVPLYCQRISQRFQHDPNSKSTTFTIVDKQHPTENALPSKCLKMDLTHEVSSAIFGGRLEGKGFHQWNNVIQGSITLPPGEPFITAYLLFQFYARQRLFRTEPHGVAFDQARLLGEDLEIDLTPAEKTVFARNILTKVSYKEALFDRTHHFRIEYIGVYDRDRLIQQSGLYTPLYNYKEDSGGAYKNWYDLDTNPKTDREPWHKDFSRPTTNVGPNGRASLTSQWLEYKNQFGDNHPGFNVYPLSAWNVYGYTGMNEDDFGPWVYFPEYQTVDQTKISRVDNAPAGHLPNWIYPANTPDNDESSAQNQPVYVDLDPKKSYITQENTFTIIEDVNTFQIARQAYDSRIDNAMKSQLGNSPVGKDNKFVSLHNMQSNSDIPVTTDYTASYNSQPTTTIMMTGYAVRAGFPPTIPCAFYYKGSSLIRSGQSVVSVKQIAKGAIPVYLATWSIPYYANTSVHTNFFKDLESTGFSGVLT
jgi:hypothetical protein